METHFTKSKQPKNILNVKKIMCTVQILDFINKHKPISASLKTYWATSKAWYDYLSPYGIKFWNDTRMLNDENGLEIYKKKIGEINRSADYWTQKI